MKIIKNNKIRILLIFIIILFFISIVPIANASTLPEFIQLSISPDEITVGEYVSLTWQTRNADRVTISHGINPSEAMSGSVILHPTTTTTYTVTAYKGSNRIIEYLDVTVSKPKPTVEIGADKTIIIVGNAVTISWKANNANSVDISPQVTTDGNLQGSLAIYPIRTTTYVATAVGDSGSDNHAITIYVYGEDGLLISSDSGFDVLQWIFIAIVIIFIFSNLIYFQKLKRWPPYLSFFGKIWAWIKNKEYVEKKSNKTKDYSSNYDYVVEYDDMDNEATNLYRRKKRNKRKKIKGGER